MVTTPPSRVTDADAIISEVVERLVAHGNPERIVLFGSRARGDGRPDSDIDLLVIVPNGTNMRQSAQAMRISLGGLPIHQDVLVTTPATLQERGRAHTSILRTALTEGTTLYQRDPPSPALTRAAAVCTAERPNMNNNDPADRREALDWIKKATRDLRRAYVCLHLTPLDADGVCGQSQQAAEKALKAAYALDGVGYELTHNLDILQRDLPPGWPRHWSAADLITLTNWHIYARYPGPHDDPTEAEARVAIALAQDIYDHILDEFLRRGLDVRADFPLHLRDSNPTAHPEEPPGKDI